MILKAKSQYNQTKEIEVQSFSQTKEILKLFESV